ncbi:hypothetical protein NZD88_00325 [Chryseobacterium antibioticum]|uniref:PsbP C-terminal domain-containing protein n=1 Tax=Chryseobacterium pyrolae TaxID=2987481 RepID=A0ABT2IBI8_9FLAO|nr:hypothetical protein [Chryseobacterium pyrolae]MCT2405995.1 hypothetical protein [Chryseobacterium pyrolae]
MTKKIKFLIALFSLITFSLHAQNKTIDYLSIPGPIKMDNKTYNLVWSSHPNENYYKQEYLSSNENIEKYNTLTLIEFVKGDFDLKDVVDQKVSELEKMKQSNPVVNYKTYENKGEYIVDFLMSENSKDGKEILIAERNIYRYKVITVNGSKGVLLFAISERGYKENMEKFFNNLKNNSSHLIEVVGNYKLPDVQLK